nr:hypothetical protein [Tanacetum cinerariifolium]
MRISLLYRGEYSQWVERFMNYLEEKTNRETMINSIKNCDQALLRVTQVSIAGTSSTEQPSLKDKSMWSDQEKRIQKIDCLARSLLIQGLPNDIYSLIDSNKTAKDLWDALARHMLGSEYNSDATQGSASKVSFEAVGASAKSSNTDAAAKVKSRYENSIVGFFLGKDPSYLDLIEIDAAVGLKKEVSMAIPAEERDGHIKEATVMEEKDDGFKEVKSRKKKKKGADS